MTKYHIVNDYQTPSWINQGLQQIKLIFHRNLCCLTDKSQVFSGLFNKRIKLSETQIYIIILSGGFVGRILGSLMKLDLLLIKNVLTLLAKSVLVPLGLTATASAADAGINKEILRSEAATLMISNKERKDIREIVKSLEDSALSIKGVTKTIKNEAKEQKRWISWYATGALGANLMGNMLEGQSVIQAGNGVVRDAQDFLFCLIV